MAGKDERSSFFFFSVCVFSLLFALYVYLTFITFSVPPSFHLHHLRFHLFHLTLPQHPHSSSPQIDARLNLTVLVRNPNEVPIAYDPMSVSASYNGFDLAHGSFEGFFQLENFFWVQSIYQRNLNAVLSSNGTRKIDSETAALMWSDLKRNNKRELPLDIKIVTKIQISRRPKSPVYVTGITVSCNGINVAVPSGEENPGPASEGKCTVEW